MEFKIKKTLHYNEYIYGTDNILGAEGTGAADTKY